MTIILIQKKTGLYEGDSLGEHIYIIFYTNIKRQNIIK